MQVGKMLKEQILEADSIRIYELIHSGQISSFEVTKMYIKQIEQVNGELNCLVESRFEEALREAEQADEAIRNNQTNGKLFGVPISMKESFDVNGMQTTGGLQQRKGFIQQRDAEIVGKLKSEGAIIVGKTNTPELCFCQETDNKLYGRTNNPHNVNRTAGGSSGGEGAMIAAGCAAVGIGSDIGGSIRFPSHFNGVVGFKSGMHQVSQQGSFPFVEHPLQKRMLGIGPMAKTVRDAKHIYSIIAEKPYEEKSLDDFTIIQLPENIFPLNERTKQLFEDVTSTISELIKVETEAPPLFQESAQLWQEIMSIDGAMDIRNITEKNAIQQYVREQLFKDAAIHRYLSWALIGASLFKPSAKRLAEIESIIKTGDEILHDYFQHKIGILPVYHTSALPHGEVYREIFSIRKTYLTYMPYVAYANVWGLPALTIPIGVCDEGLPIAFQLISVNGNEDALFQLGTKIEQHFRGYVRAQV